MSSENLASTAPSTPPIKSVLSEEAMNNSESQDSVMSTGGGAKDDEVPKTGEDAAGDSLSQDSDGKPFTGVSSSVIDSLLPMVDPEEKVNYVLPSNGTVPTEEEETQNVSS